MAMKGGSVCGLEAQTTWPISTATCPTASKCCVLAVKLCWRSCGAYLDTSHEFDDFSLGITLNPVTNDSWLGFNLGRYDFIKSRMKFRTCLTWLETGKTIIQLHLCLPVSCNSNNTHTRIFQLVPGARYQPPIPDITPANLILCLLFVLSFVCLQAKYISTCIDEIKQELKQDNIAVKANAVCKLTYVRSLKALHWFTDSFCLTLTLDTQALINLRIVTVCVWLSVPYRVISIQLWWLHFKKRLCGLELETKYN